MRLVGAASAIPDNRTSGEEIEARLGLEKGWIERRTGVRQRPTSPATETTSDLAIKAGAAALELADVDRGRIGLVLLATSTPDHLLPPCHAIGISLGVCRRPRQVPYQGDAQGHGKYQASS